MCFWRPKRCCLAEYLIVFSLGFYTLVTVWYWAQQHQENLGLDIFHKLHSEILASLNFNKNKNFVPWIGEQTYTEMLVWQFSNITIYVKSVGKITNEHLSVRLFSNPGDKVQTLVESAGQICPFVLHLFSTLSPGFENNHTFKCSAGIFQTILTYII